MISDVLSAIIIGLMVILVLYPASQLVRQTWNARKSRVRLEGNTSEPPQ